ncbi:nucleoside triphosphate pyrophosphohydrolase [Parerythrobacter lacustris]|uniref:Nucleoside triphosphate pyrophosphohydrolase n=1 Tax=Parerythrobacter lacustris TaxID=2969984 RepID=A0ABT1XQ69_9SPHN|nr:nucleoside triphosphate pyrophosphohydrolase [Parerythrobacter lacustris]MCR2833808.1 nucleoside triphosphate pyrophosphohydrolase [Parerythrobacter lacustris]
MSDSIARLLQIMATLRDPEQGCEWDLAQNFNTIAPYTIEEAYEVADAISRQDHEDLRSELGDLLFQVVFHARIAEEQGHFTFDDVANTISDKMEARHPHIFGEQSGTMNEQRWEDLKAAEREASGATSAMDGVALALPALQRSDKLQKRAARVGFEWPDIAGPIEKLQEELMELESADTDEDRLLEAGDILFVIVNLVRRYGVDPEQALRASNAKFERRFRRMELLATGDGRNFFQLSLDEQEAYWQRVKAEERQGASHDAALIAAQSDRY